VEDQGRTTIGVEEELFVIDADSGALVPRGRELLADVPAHTPGSVAAELNECQAETNSDPVESLDDLAAQLTALRSGLRAAGRPLGVRPVALGSHPLARWHDQSVNTSKPHYQRLVDTYQAVARRTVICGCHVHVRVDDPDQRIRRLSTLTPWLPVLLALSANSPWWDGSDSGYASYRTIVWKAWPTATFPPRLRDHQDYLDLIESLRVTEAIDDDASLYWYVRPSTKFPTLEFRVSDTCLRVEDAVVMAGLARALTETAGREDWSPDDVPPSTFIDHSLWWAARYGLGDRLVDPASSILVPAADAVASLLRATEEALRDNDDYQRVTDGLHRILTDGNGASVQRALLASGGAAERSLLDLAE
jgi:carboxylate-amine ligase